MDDARLLKNVTAREKYKESVGGTLHPGIGRPPGDTVHTCTPLVALSSLKDNAHSVEHDGSRSPSVRMGAATTAPRRDGVISTPAARGGAQAWLQVPDVRLSYAAGPGHRPRRW